MRSLVGMVTLLLAAGPAFAQDAGEGNWDPMSGDEWESAETLISWLEQDWSTTWTAEMGHAITSVVDSADEEGVTYVSTTRDDGGATQLSIFRFSQSGFERLWRDDDAGDLAWYVVGHDGEQVIYAETVGSYDPGECGEPLVAGADGTDGASLWALPDTYAESWDLGPSAYTSDQTVVDEVRARQTECEGGA